MPVKTKSLAHAYLKGWGSLLLAAGTLVGGVFAWRLANMLFDRMIGNKEK